MSFAEAILSIPLARSKPPDTMIWRFEGTRVYTEKSGYKLILHDKLQSLRDFPIATTTTIKTFSELWTLQLPEKIKITLWKVYNDFIPTYANLNKRNIPTPVVCPLCQESTETIDHLLRFCSVTSQILRVLQIIVPLSQNTQITELG